MNRSKKYSSKFAKLINGEKPVLVDFYATWCGPCKLMTPILKELKKKMGDRLTIIKINTDKNQEAAAKYQIRGIPTLILFQNGQIKWRKSGVVQAHDLVKLISAKIS